MDRAGAVPTAGCDVRRQPADRGRDTPVETPETSLERGQQAG